jgi:hypothetical protein
VLDSCHRRGSPCGSTSCHPGAFSRQNCTSSALRGAVPCHPKPSVSVRSLARTRVSAPRSSNNGVWARCAISPVGNEAGGLAEELDQPYGPRSAAGTTAIPSGRPGSRASSSSSTIRRRSRPPLGLPFVTLEDYHLTAVYAAVRELRGTRARGMGGPQKALWETLETGSIGFLPLASSPVAVRQGFSGCEPLEPRLPGRAFETLDRRSSAVTSRASSSSARAR